MNVSSVATVVMDTGDCLRYVTSVGMDTSDCLRYVASVGMDTSDCLVRGHCCHGYQ